MPIANELNINTSVSALDMANAIFGNGIQVISATYTGATMSAGTYTGALSTLGNVSSGGIVNSDTGVILSTGNVADFTNSSGTTNTNEVSNRSTNTTGSVDGDAQLNTVAGQATYDGAILTADFIPTGDMITMQFVFTSEEFPEYISSNVNDAFGVWVNGTFVPVTVTVAGNVAIDEINQNKNSNLYRDNTGDQFNTEMDGVTRILSFKAPVVQGQVNSIKIGIADGGDAVWDSNLLIMGDSVQTFALATDDTIQLTTNSSRTFDILANDRDLTNSGLTITHINGTAVIAGQTVTLGTGERVRLNADGTVTVFSDGDIGSNALNYTIVDSQGNTDTGFITIKTVATTGPDGIVQGTSGADVIQAGYTGDPDGDRVDNNDALGVGGTTGNGDYILAGGGNDSIIGNLGNDVIYGGAGDDTAFGGAGNDWANLGSGNDSFGTFNADSEGNDTVYGDAGNDYLIGGGQNDVLYGGTGNDTLSGGVGSDTVYGGQDADVFLVTDDHQADTLIGGETGDDNDLIAFGNFVSTNGITVTATGAEAGTYQFNGTSSGTAGVYSEIESISATVYNDTLNFAADGSGITAYGLGGNDTITGGAGDDQLYGGLGADSITGGAGDDYLGGDEGNDFLHAGAGNDRVVAGIGNDTILVQAGEGADSIFGGEGSPDTDLLQLYSATSGVGVNITFTGNEAGNYAFTSGGGSGNFAEIEAISTTNSNDVVNAAASGVAQEIYTNGGDDQLTGGSGNDTLGSGTGHDTVSGGDGNDTIWADAGNDIIYGGAGADVVTAGDDIDVIYGGVGDTVYGGEGGTDNDTLILNYADIATISYGGGNNEAGTVTFKTGGTLTFSEIENLRFLGPVDGTSGDDTMLAGYTDLQGDQIDGTDGLNDTIFGHEGNDWIEATNGNDTVFGGVGNDTIFGGIGSNELHGDAGDDFIWTDNSNDTLSGLNDTLYGGTGNDTLYSRYGDDSLFGGTGNDILHGGPGQDTAYGGEGDDQLNGGVDGAVDLFYGEAGNDELRGDDGNDSLYGGADNDLIYGGNDADQIEGGSGNDSAYGDGGNDIILGEAGSDELTGGDGDDSIDGGADQDALYGNVGADTLVGGLGNDQLFGGADADLIKGGEGDDAAEGGDGNDTMLGDAGNDVLFGNGGDDSLAGGAGNDTIWAGEQNDVLEGGAGTDQLNGEAGDDTFTLSTGFGADTITGGESAETVGDTLNLNGLAGAVRVDLTAYDPEAGTVTQGGDSAQFSQIENIVLGAAVETIVLADGSGGDTIKGFTLPTLQGGGIYAGVDQLDVSGLHDALGNPVNVNDVTVGNDGNGNAVLTFPNGESLTLVGVTPAQVSNPAVLAAMGIPAETLDFIVEGTSGGDLINGAYTGDPEGDRIDAQDALNGSNDDLVYAGNGNDTVLAGTGNDWVFGDGGNDLVYGEAGNDYLDGGGNDDVVYGGAGNDSLSDGDSGNDVLFGDEGNDELSSNSGDDTLYGGDGNDRLYANSSADDATLEGGAGDDSIYGSWAAGGDQIAGGDGHDYIAANGGNDTIDAGAGNDFVDAGDNDDSVEGGAGKDTLDGALGADTLGGDDGDDTLRGGDGNDVLTGGEGADRMLGQADRDLFYAGLGDVVDGGETGDDYDVLDLTAWGHPATNIIYDSANPENGTVEFLDADGNVVGTMSFTNIESVVACFTPGAMVLTETGEVPVENLRAGDRVLTRDNGYQPIRWTGRRELSHAELIVEPRFNPVFIAKGALGNNLPERDMMVSPQHRMLITGPRAELLFGENEVLVAAKHLLGMAGVEQRVSKGVTYIHILFDQHEIVRADGAWSESFQPGDQTLEGMDAAQRAEILALFPELSAGGSVQSARLTLKAKEARALILA
jgi:Ca2+-binding RTX toxin-like protein